jgi:hypothetical protein
MPLFLLPLFRSLLSSLSLSFSFPVLPSLFYHSIVSLLSPYYIPFIPPLLPYSPSFLPSPLNQPEHHPSQHPNTPRQNPTPTKTLKMVSVATQKKANSAVIWISTVLSGINLIILLITLPYILRHYCKPTKKGRSGRLLDCAVPVPVVRR